LRIVIADDDALILEGLSILLGMEPDMEVVGTARNGQEALDLCRKLQPDVVLMDIRMPVMDGVQGTRLIKQQLPAVKVVILTTFKDDQYIKEAMKCGAEGYMLKNQSSDSIIDSLRAVAKGSFVFQREVAGVLSSMLTEEKPRKAEASVVLTPREMDILRLVGEGLSNRELGDRLHLSEGTARNYVAALLEKLELRDRTQLAIYYLKHY
jgi:DNA-binding NarL/FixJ family response regulator